MTYAYPMHTVCIQMPYNGTDPIRSDPISTRPEYKEPTYLLVFSCLGVRGVLGTPKMVGVVFSYAGKGESKCQRKSCPTST